MLALLRVWQFNTPLVQTGPSSRFRGPGAKLQNEVSCFYDRSEPKGQEARESGGLNFEALLEPYWLLLLGGSFYASKEAINKNFDIS